MAEILIVILVISLLLAISLTVGSRVLDGGRLRATEQTMKIVDQLVTEYTASTGGKVPAFYTSTDGVDFPIVDGRLASGGAPGSGGGGAGLVQPSLSLFLLEAQRSRIADKMMTGIDSKFITRTVALAYGFQATATTVDLSPLDAPVILDGWGNPLRIVHPAFHGGFGRYYKGPGEEGEERLNLFIKPPVTLLRPGPADATEFSRSCQPFDPVATQTGQTGDADEGRCLANRPYVYSMGRDGDAGTRVDNVYLPSGTPQWPTETARVNLD